MPEQSLKWSESIDEELVGKMKLRQAVWCAPNCADSAKEEVLHSQHCLQILPACSPEGSMQNHSDNPCGHTLKRKHALYGVKNKI